MSNDEQQNPQPPMQDMNQAQEMNQPPPKRGAGGAGGAGAAGGAQPHSEAMAPPQAAHQGKPQQQNPNVRLRELLSIPERLRTDAQWDEIIDIEISIGPRKSPANLRPQHQPSFRQNDSRTDRPEKKHGGGSSGGAPGANKHMRKRNNKSPGGPQGGKPPQGGGGQGGSGGPGGAGGGGGNQGGRSGSE